MEKILVTGASGFIGKNLKSYLIRNGFMIQTMSIRYGLPFTIPKTDCIIHLSGKAHDLKKVKNPSAYYQDNFELTKKLYNAFLNSNAKKFIFLSTVKAAADNVTGVLTEDTVPNPQTHYGKSKLLAEQYIQSHPPSSGKNYYILRPCMIHGPNNKGNLNLLYQFVKKGFPCPIGAFQNYRSFLSIENLCFVIQKLIESPIETGIYNVCDDDSISTTELITIISDSIHKRVKILKIPKEMIVFLSKLGDVLKLPINTDRLTKLTENYQVANNKIINSIGSPLPLSARDGLKVTLASFKQ